MSRLFIYGTLKRAGSAHSLLTLHKPVFIEEAQTHSRYQLYDQGSFPGMVIDEYDEGGVHGEVFEVSDACLTALDYYEGVSSGLFRREEIELDDGTTAIAYLFAREFTGARKVEDGVW